MENASKIIIKQQNAIGYIILNHPSKLNAQSHQMTLEITDAVQQWSDNSDIKVIIIKSTSDKSFCAGGDIKQLMEGGIDQVENSIAFFKDEYYLNGLIAAYPKPIICFCQGITMGGGCGLSIHASHSIAGDQIKLAMPETKIGLFPDIGATFLFSRMQYKLGYYLALTGAVIGQADVIYTKLLNYAMTTAQWQQFETQLQNIVWQKDVFQQVDNLLESYLGNSTQSLLKQRQQWIAETFSKETLYDVIAYLKKSADDKDLQLLKTLQQRSPHSLLITWQALQKTQLMSLPEVLQQDLLLAKACLSYPDFYIGVKACLIDKNTPIWTSTSIEDVNQQAVDQYFN